MDVNLNCRCTFEPYVKPPFGLKPRRICLEERVVDIQMAIDRYIEARKPIPIEWTQELLEIIKQLNQEYEKYKL